mmetsp:Transcript_4908/g.19644  ORF Transcript_4908/g.19644 Transcript_4908/m.19644 type:complete len:252 (+) Transcript_4908:1351-2106(+)
MGRVRRRRRDPRTLVQPALCRLRGVRKSATRTLSNVRVRKVAPGSVLVPSVVASASAPRGEPAESRVPPRRGGREPGGVVGARAGNSSARRCLVAVHRRGRVETHVHASSHRSVTQRGPILAVGVHEDRPPRGRPGRGRRGKRNSAQTPNATKHARRPSPSFSARPAAVTRGGRVCSVAVFAKRTRFFLSCAVMVAIHVGSGMKKKVESVSLRRAPLARRVELAASVGARRAFDVARRLPPSRWAWLGGGN